MAPLFLLFEDCEQDLLGSFRRMEHEAHGVYFADGSDHAKANGTLILCGMAFDYAIHATGKPDATCRIFCDADLGKTRSAMTLDLGAAIASGQTVPAVIKALMLLGDIMGTAFGAKAVFWTPASVATGFPYYSETIRQYANGAAFPALVTVSFNTEAEDSIHTTGLGWLVGQELVFERGGMAVNEAMRYVARIVHDLATNGIVDAPMETPGLLENERLLFMPDALSKRLSVRRKYAKNGVNPAS